MKNCPDIRPKLAKVLARLGSDHDGKRAAAGPLAARMDSLEDLSRGARLHILPELAPYQFTLLVHQDPAQATSSRFIAKGSLTVVLPHLVGCQWPDARNTALAAATIEEGGLAVLAFATLADAMAAHTRCRRGT